MRKILLAAVAAVALLAVVALARAWRVQPAPKAPPAKDLVAVDRAAAVERFAGAVRIPTVSYGDRSRIDYTQFDRLHEYLAAKFPKLHGALRRELVAKYSLLYTWEGSDPSAKPILMLAHQDVVPIEPGTEKTWQHAPFSGDVADGFVWGRGAIDDKASLLAQLEAVETLVGAGFKPKRTIYFAFGHDEEINGEEGAKAMAGLLAARGVKAEFSLDEGGSITVGVVHGIAAPVASIMTAEKGYLSLDLVAHDAGGHSSRPPKVSAVGRLARAVARLEQHQMPTRLAAPVTALLGRLAPYLGFGDRLAAANPWLFGPFIERRMADDRTTNALVRTTTAPTMFNAGIKDNVLPVEARATVNFRLLPGDSIASVEQHVRDVIADPGVEVTAEPFASEPSPVADVGAPAFAAIERTVNEVFPDAIVTAGIVIGATDNRHYGAVREQRYNFAPETQLSEDLLRVHGANERLGVDDYARAVQFYARLLQNVAG